MHRPLKRRQPTLLTLLRQPGEFVLFQRATHYFGSFSTLGTNEQHSCEVCDFTCQKIVPLHSLSSRVNIRFSIKRKLFDVSRLKLVHLGIVIYLRCSCSLRRITCRRGRQWSAQVHLPLLHLWAKFQCIAERTYETRLKHCHLFANEPQVFVHFRKNHSQHTATFPSTFSVNIVAEHTNIHIFYFILVFSALLRHGLSYSH